MSQTEEVLRDELSLLVLHAEAGMSEEVSSIANRIVHSYCLIVDACMSYEKPKGKSKKVGTG